MCRVLFWQWHSFMGRGIEKAFRKLAISYDTFFYQLTDWEEDVKFQEELEQKLTEGEYAAVFSVNYTPLITEVCDRLGILYISWIYDSPIHIRATEPLKKACNCMYVFDRGQAEEYNRQGIHACYLPLAADRTDFEEVLRKRTGTYRAQVSFVGQLYQTEYAYYMTPLDEWQKGYLEGLIVSQMKLYGAYLLPELLSNELVQSLNLKYAQASNGTASITKRELEYMLACEITGRERTAVLTELAKQFEVQLYTGSEAQELDKVHRNGYVDYYTQMPQVFADSDVNLNITLKTIRTGIPLRVLDVLSCGGFLISNYQTELAEYFALGEELVVYQDIEEIPELVRYYLTHEEERKRIAEKGRERIERDFRYEDRIRSIWTDVFQN